MTEVNFWQPSGGREFHVLAPGEPFFFKTHYPHNKVVGGGLFSDSARLRVPEAWEFFGEANGAASMEQMRARIGRYRRAPIGPGDDPVIGCLFVRDVRFFPEDAMVAPPPQFAPNIVQGKSYDLAGSPAAPYFAELLQLILGRAVELDFSQPWHRSGPVFGDRGWRPTGLARARSKRSYWTLTTAAALSAERTYRPCCRQPDIRPVTAGGEHRLDNGLLLRSDVHTLFDRGYLGVDPKFRLCVSSRLRADFSNGMSSTPRQDRPSSFPDAAPTGPAGNF